MVSLSTPILRMDFSSQVSLRIIFRRSTWLGALRGSELTPVEVAGLAANYADFSVAVQRGMSNLTNTLQMHLAVRNVLHYLRYFRV